MKVYIVDYINHLINLYLLGFLTDFVSDPLLIISKTQRQKYSHWNEDTKCFQYTCILTNKHIFRIKISVAKLEIKIADNGDFQYIC